MRPRRKTPFQEDDSQERLDGTDPLRVEVNYPSTRALFLESLIHGIVFATLCVLIQPVFPYYDGVNSYYSEGESEVKGILPKLRRAMPCISLFKRGNQ